MTRGTKSVALKTAAAVLLTAGSVVALFSISDARRGSEGGRAATTVTSTPKRGSDGPRSTTSTTEGSDDRNGDDDRDDDRDDQESAECRTRADERRRERAREGRGVDDDHDNDSDAEPDGQLLPSFEVGLDPTTFVKVDRNGRIVSAATNTGCRPISGDTVYLFLPDGSITLAPYLDLDEIDWKGSFRSPGEFYRQTPQRGCLKTTPCAHGR
jgi:hypothetical protein